MLIKSDFNEFLSLNKNFFTDNLKEICSDTESDPYAVCFQMLTMIGNVFGRHSYYFVEGAKHYPNLFTAIVGASSNSRKGTSYNQALNAVKICDPSWSSQNILSGISSGEGIIQFCSNLEKSKRVQIKETEMASLLKNMSRKGNVISPVLRDAWDSGDMMLSTKNNPLAVNDVHLSIIAHITQAELKIELKNAEIYNGFGNRFLWVHVQRSKLLPFGGTKKINLKIFKAKLFVAVKKAKENRRVTMDTEASKYWEGIYLELTQERDGPIGSLTSRAESQVIRISLLLSLLNQNNQITIEDIKQAHFLWRYVEWSIDKIFNKINRDKNSTKLLNFLRSREQGKDISRSDISKEVFGGNLNTEQIDTAIKSLQSEGLLTTYSEPGKGRKPVEMWGLSEWDDAKH